MEHDKGEGAMKIGDKVKVNIANYKKRNYPKNYVSFHCQICGKNYAVAVADSFELAPYGLYGIRAIYKGDKEVDVLIIDEGSAIVPVCTIEAD